MDSDSRYSTECLFEGAVVIINGFSPDSYLPIHSNGQKRAVTIAMVWDNLPDEVVDKIHSENYSVNPFILKKAYLELKAQINILKDKHSV